MRSAQVATGWLRRSEGSRPHMRSHISTDGQLADDIQVYEASNKNGHPTSYSVLGAHHLVIGNNGRTIRNFLSPMDTYGVSPA